MRDQSLLGTAQHAAPGPRLVNVATVAEWLSICQRSVWNLVKKGQLAVVPICRRKLFDVEDVRAFIESSKSKGVAQ